MSVFHVLTEFKFGIGEALLNSERLQGAVGGISEAADNALLSLTKLGAGAAIQAGLTGVGIAGILGKSIQIADKFALSQNAFSNIISSNMEHLQGQIGTFNDRLLVTETIFNKIGVAAREFALDEGELLDMVKLTSAQLIPKGLAGDNMQGSIDLSRNLLKSAPSLGLNIQDIQGQLLRTIEGGASMGDTLFRRLLTDTKAFAPFRGGAPGGAQGGGMSGAAGGLATSMTKAANATAKFNALKPEQRIKVLQEALQQFASDTSVLKANVDSLGGQFRLMSNLLIGPISSILRPLGEALRKPIVQVMQTINHFLDTNGRQLIKSASRIISRLLEDPKKLLIDLMQLRELKKDVRMGAHILGIVEFMSGIPVILAFARRVLGLVPNLKILERALEFVSTAGQRLKTTLFDLGGKAARFLFSMKGLTFLFETAQFVVGSILFPLTLLVTILQGISRGIATAKVEDAEAFARLAPQIANFLEHMSVAMKNIFLPITLAIEGIAQITKEIFKMSTSVEFLTPALGGVAKFFEDFGESVVFVFGILAGAFSGLFQIIDNIARQGIAQAILGGTMFDGVGKAASEGMDDFIKRNTARVQEGKGVQNNVTNNNFSGSITIRNDFKEQQEPDRIAFKMSEQLQKLGQNRTQSRGRSLRAGFVGGQ